MLPGTSRDLALEVAERLRNAIAATIIEVSAGKIGVTVSIGLATRTAAEKDVELLLQSADIAVYDAKSRGRNRTVCYGETRAVATAADQSAGKRQAAVH